MYLFEKASVGAEETKRGRAMQRAADMPLLLQATITSRGTQSLYLTKCYKNIVKEGCCRVQAAAFGHEQLDAFPAGDETVTGLWLVAGEGAVEARLRLPARLQFRF